MVGVFGTMAEDASHTSHLGTLSALVQPIVVDGPITQLGRTVLDEGKI